MWETTGDGLFHWRKPYYGLWTFGQKLHFSKSAKETNSSTSWMAWGWAHFQLIFIFGWTIPLMKSVSNSTCHLKCNTHLCIYIYKLLKTFPLRPASWSDNLVEFTFACMHLSDDFIDAFSSCFSHKHQFGIIAWPIWIEFERFIPSGLFKQQLKPSRSVSWCPLVYEFWLSGSVWSCGGSSLLTVCCD